MYNYRMFIKQVLALFAIILSIISYIPYIRDIIKGKTKPHAFTWLIWTILGIVGFSAQISDNAGPGAYMNLVNIFVGIYILFAGFKYRSNIVKSDYISLIMALLTIPLWLITKNPLWSVLLILIIDIFAFIPTIRKSFMNPYSETAETYFINSLKHLLSISALTRYTLITSLYPSYLVSVNFLFLVFLMTRRKYVVMNK